MDARSAPGEKLGMQLTLGSALRDIAAAAVSAVVLLTSIVSFASLMFSRALAAGAPTVRISAIVDAQISLIVDAVSA